MSAFLLSIIEPTGNGDRSTPPENLDAIVADVTALHEEMERAGVVTFSGGLTPPRGATVVREGVPSRGPYAEAAEFIGGLTIVDVQDAEEATQWAARLSEATTLPVEVRAFVAS